MSGPIVGIDLGTTYSCVGVWENDAVTIIANKHGHRTTPSWVSYHNGERLVGEAAKLAAARVPRNTIYDSKRLIGCRWSDAAVQDDLKHFPFSVVPDENDNPRIEITFNGDRKLISAEEVAAAILSHMKCIAEDYLGCPVERAVVTVPSYFNDSQRNSTKDAGAVAGLDIIRLINEPTAAAIAYGLNTDSTEHKNLIVFDIGGGTLDVTLLTVEDGVFEVLATCGDTHLGGEDFDNNLVKYCLDYIKNTHNVDASTNPRALKRLKDKCQEAKHALSSNLKVDVFIESLADDIDLDLLVTREQFEEINKPLFDRCLAPVHTALGFAKLEAGAINDVLLIGGSSRIPYIQQMLEEFFVGKKCSKRINPDEAVAFGASIVAASASKDVEKEGSRLKGITLLDVTPLNLGIELADGRMSVMISANTTIPYEHSKIYHNTEDGQTEVEVLIYEGMDKIARNNKLLGCFTVLGLPPRPRGKLDVEVMFSINVNGITHVSARVLGTDAIGNIQIQSDKKLLSEDAITAKAHEEAQFQQQDAAKKKFDQLEELCGACKRANVQSDEFTAARNFVSEKKASISTKEYYTIAAEIDHHIAQLQNSKPA